LLKDINYAISLLDPNGQQIYLNVGDNTTPYLGVKAAEGIDTQTVYIASEGIHIMSLALTGTGITNWEKSVLSDQHLRLEKLENLLHRFQNCTSQKLLSQVGSRTTQDGGLTDR